MYDFASPNGSAINCTIVGNSATNTAGGLWSTNLALYNCIIYYNTSQFGEPNLDGTATGPAGGIPSPFYCCTSVESIYFPQDLLIDHNVTNEPLFINAAAGDFRLQSNSPCIDAGYNTAVGTSTDLDGHPRIIGGTVDMGAYEFVPSVSMRIARTSPNITLAWPLWASNFVAQEAGGLPFGPGGWSNVAATVSQTAGENVVTVPGTNVAKFFRLFLP